MLYINILNVLFITTINSFFPGSYHFHFINFGPINDFLIIDFIVKLNKTFNFVIRER